jgi:hypothetical protein
MADDVADLPTADEIVAAQPPRRPGGPEDPTRRDDPPVPAPDEDEPPDDEPDEENDPDEDPPIPADLPEPHSEPPGQPAAVAAAPPDGRSRASRLVDGAIPPPKTVRYEARIQILEAWQYLGAMLTAPPWIDRNWIAFAEANEELKLPAGPAIMVPTGAGDKLARRGDYVCRQEVRLTEDLPGDIRLEVWPRDVFEKLFLPVRTRRSPLLTMDVEAA